MNFRPKLNYLNVITLRKVRSLKKNIKLYDIL